MLVASNVIVIVICCSLRESKRSPRIVNSKAISVNILKCSHLSSILLNLQILTYIRFDFAKIIVM